MSNTIPEIIDISSWKQDIDHAKVAAAGVKVVICRTTCSQVSADLSYMYHRQQFRRYGVEVPGYMFPQFQYDVVFQVKCFIAIWGAHWFPPVVDLERLNNCRGDVVARKTTMILTEIMRRTRRIPMIYTRGIWFNRHIYPHVKWAGRFPLMVAHYTKRSKPNMPKGWKDYTLWQYSKYGRVPGIRSSVDFNRLGDTVDYLEKGTYIDADIENPTYKDNPTW